MCMTYPFANPEYLLNKMTLEQIFFYFDHAYGILNGKPSGVNKNKPDKEKFHEKYGDKIKTPNKKGG